MHCGTPFDIWLYVLYVVDICDECDECMTVDADACAMPGHRTHITMVVVKCIQTFCCAFPLTRKPEVRCRSCRRQNMLLEPMWVCACGYAVCCVLAKQHLAGVGVCLWISCVLCPGKTAPTMMCSQSESHQKSTSSSAYRACPGLEPCHSMIRV
jgi:hypothetical protein